LNGLVLEGHAEAGTPVTTATKNSTTVQKWKLTKDNHLENGSGLVLDYKEENGVKRAIVAEKSNDSETQKWHYEGPVIINNSTGLALDIKEAKKEEGAEVILWEKHGQTHQQWGFHFGCKCSIYRSMS
jgi:hypothetical protein